jgi:hypothetical protein
MTAPRMHASVCIMNTNGSGLGRAAVIIAAIAVACCGGAFAQNDDEKVTEPPITQPPAAQPPGSQQQGAQNDPLSSIVGAWEFSNADHDKICHFTFRSDPLASGYKLDIDKNCPNVFPSTRDIVAWAVDSYGSLRLLDARGDAVVELTEVESGMYDGFTPEEGRYILQTAAAATPAHSADDLAGDWAVTRGAGKPICALTLANSPAGTDALTLKIKPGCDALVTRFNPSAWRMEQGQLVLLSPRGQTWQFEENDTNTWQRVPETSDPILLVRQ